MIHVDIHCDTVGTHLLQIFSGLYLLQQQGKISISFKSGLAITSARPNRQFLVLRVFPSKNSKEYKTILFDIQDSPTLGLPDAFAQIDFYVKRSLEPETYQGLASSAADKLIPFGLNYQVLGFSSSFLFRMCAFEYVSRPYNPLGRKHNFHVHNVKDLFDASFLKRENGLLTVNELNPGKSAANATSVLFQCRLWDPQEVAVQNKGDTENVNNSRIALIRELKQVLGKGFVGGLQNTAYARKKAPDLISTMPTARRDYIELVRNSAIVISTSGLLKSNGWKLGEYVALGKAIISEPISTKLPGDFAAPKNYLKYDSVSECLDNINTLISSPEKIVLMEQENRQYYENFLEPSVQVLNIFKKCKIS
jgi:hypothetical protein